MEIQEETRVVRYIEYEGIRFYEDKRGYWLGRAAGADGSLHRVRLHVYVWEKHNGPVPAGYEIHHIDRDTSNNEIDNLVALPSDEHHRLHMLERDKGQLMEYISRAQAAAAQWHGSETGRAWHREHYQQTLAPHWDEMETRICEYCGKSFVSPALTADRARFCSNRCKTAFRYHAGLDNETRVCPICGKSFVANKYSATKTCSKECGAVSQSRTKAAKRRPPA